MRRYRKFTKTEAILFFLIAVIVIVLSIFYANLKDTPTWKEISRFFGASATDNYNDCVKFFDVGQGDSALITSGGRNAVIDVGTPEGAKKLCRKFKKSGVKTIDALLFSHNHDDHIGGGEEAVARYKIKNLLLPDITRTDSPTRIIKTVEKSVDLSGGNCYMMRSGAYFNVGDFKITVLCQYIECEDENERSAVVMADRNGTKFLFTGDIGKSAESRIIKDGINVNCDVLKVAHHGSGGSSTDKFLEVATPEYAVISCGEGNSYNHPHDQTMVRLEKIGACILRTDISGDIIFAFENDKLKVETEK